MNKNLSIHGAILAGALLLPAAGFAGSVGSVGGAAAGAIQYRLPGQKSSCNYLGGMSGGCGYTTTSDFFPYYSSDGKNWTSTSGSVTLDTASSVDMQGGLHAKASVTMINDPLDPGALTHYAGSDDASASATASWTDTLTFNGPAAAKVTFGFVIDGNLSASHGRADAKVDWSAGSDRGTLAIGTWTFSTLSAIGPNPSSPTQLLSTFTFEPGETVTIHLRLLAQAIVGCQALQGPMLCSGSATSDMSHTLKFDTITFQDAAGHDLSGYSISSPNFDYGSFMKGGATAPVPEPGTAAMLTFGLLGLLGATARQRRR